MKIKKIIIIILILSFLFINYKSSISIWQYNFDPIEKISSWNNLKEIKLDSKAMVWTRWLNSIRTYFCNDWVDESKLTDSLSIIARPWEEKEICIIQFNVGSEDIYSWWAFPENKLFWSWRWCDDQNSRGNAFAKFMKPFPEESVKIPAKWYVIRKTTIKFPIWVKWMQYWCFAFWEAQKEIKLYWWMFNVLVRRVNYITILVDWQEYSFSEKITKIFTTNKKYIFWVLFFIVLSIIVFEIKKNIYKK